MEVTRRNLFSVLFAAPAAIALANATTEDITAPERAMVSTPKNHRLYQVGYMVDISSADMSGNNKAIILDKAQNKCAIRIADDLRAKFGTIERLTFLALDVPTGVYSAGSGPMGPIACARSVQIYDGFRDCWIVRVDALVVRP